MSSFLFEQEVQCLLKDIETGDISLRSIVVELIHAREDIAWLKSYIEINRHKISYSMVRLIGEHDVM